MVKQNHFKKKKIPNNQIDQSDFSRLSYNRASNTPNLLFLISIILLAVIIISTFSFLYWQQKNRNSVNENGLINLQLNCPQEIFAGEQIDCKLELKNPQGVTLNNVTVDFSFPSGFTLLNSQPELTKQLTQGAHWELDRLLAKKQQEVILQGVLLGDWQENKIISAVVNFEPSNFSSNFQKQIQTTINVSRSLLSADLTIPMEILPGQDRQYCWQIKNISQQPLDNIGVIFQHPDGWRTREPFLIDQTLNNLWLSGSLNNDLRWMVDHLDQQQSKQICLDAHLLGEASNCEFNLQVGLVDIKNNFYQQAESKQIITLSDLPFITNLLINQQSEKQIISHWGERLNYQLTYQNTGSKEVKDLVIKLFIEQSQIIDWAKLTNDTWNLQIGQQTINSSNWQQETTSEGKYLIWNSQNIAELATIKKNASGKLSFQLPLISEQQASKTKLIQVNLISRGEFFGISDGDKWQQRTIRIENKISDQITFSNTVRYYDDNYLAIGSGPIPPQINQATTYWINWQLNNFNNRLKKIKIVSVLPTQVKWVDKIKGSTSGQPVFDAETREVSWTIDYLSPYLTPQVSFAVEINPRAEQIGQTIILTEATYLTGQDDFTKQMINLNTVAIDTNLLIDPLINGQGKVIGDK